LEIKNAKKYKKSICNKTLKSLVEFNYSIYNRIQFISEIKMRARLIFNRVIYLPPLSFSWSCSLATSDSLTFMVSITELMTTGNGPLEIPLWESKQLRLCSERFVILLESQRLHKEPVCKSEPEFLGFSSDQRSPIIIHPQSTLPHTKRYYYF